MPCNVLETQRTEEAVRYERPCGLRATALYHHPWLWVEMYLKGGRFLQQIAAERGKPWDVQDPYAALQVPGTADSDSNAYSRESMALRLGHYFVQACHWPETRGTVRQAAIGNGPDG